MVSTAKPGFSVSCNFRRLLNRFAVLDSKYFNTRLCFDGAYTLTYTAAIADFFDYVRFLDGSYNSVKSDYLYIPGTDRFVGDRAMFLTDDTINFSCKRKAVIFVKDRLADNLPPLCRNRQIRYCTGRADLAAQGAVILTVTKTGNDKWCVDALDTGLPG